MLFAVTCLCGAWVAEQPWGVGELWASSVCAEAHAVPAGDQHLHLLVANARLAVSAVPAVVAYSLHCRPGALGRRQSLKTVAESASVAPVSEHV